MGSRNKLASSLILASLLASPVLAPPAPTYFSLLINAESQAKAVLDQAEKVLHAKSGAILSDSGAQSKSFVEAMKKEMEARKMRLTAAQEYQYRATDLTAQLLTL